MYGDLEEEEVVVAEAGNLDDQLKIQVRVLYFFPKLLLGSTFDQTLN